MINHPKLETADSINRHVIIALWPNYTYTLIVTHNLFKQAFMKFWETKTLTEMTIAEWESLCDGCAKCCLNKLEDEDSGQIYFTSVVCNLINLDTCRCTRYSERTTLVPDCIELRQHDFSEYTWLPSTCAYRLLSDGKPLPDWHPLVSGTQESVKEVGVSISSYAIKESQVDELEEHIIKWL